MNASYSMKQIYYLMKIIYLFHFISYQLFGTQNKYEEIILSTYNHIKNNPIF